MIKMEVKSNIKAGDAKTQTKEYGVLSDADKVNEYMDKLEHPLKAEMEAVRKIIKSNKQIKERIKWAAPSYYYKADIVTFNHRAIKQVHLVFHHPSIVNIKSTILEGTYKDRRMAYFSDIDEIKTKSKELKMIIDELVKFQDNL
jgi:uncharacterized protein YdeI (YjbR/CyaY-like superfamily)